MNPILHPLRQLFSAFSAQGMAHDAEAARSAHIDAAVVSELCAPVSSTEPCGPSLEYDNDYAVLQARLSPKADVQYGDFASRPEGPDWLEVERDARRLLGLSKDISILIWFTRARTRMAGAAGLLEGLATLRALLQTFPQDIHPHMSIEGEFDPAVRANALAALCDPEGLLGDVRDIVVSASTASRLTVRDAERAFAVPRPPYAAEPEHVRRQLADLYRKADPNLMAMLSCGSCLGDIAEWCARTMQTDAPDLSSLLKLLACMAHLDDAVMPAPKVQALQVDAAPVARLVDTHPDGAVPGPSGIGTPVALPGAGNVAQQREQIRQLLGQVREWIDQHEPSSPVSVLLKQADRMWGKRFSEVATMIPAELLQAWDRQE